MQKSLEILSNKKLRMLIIAILVIVFVIVMVVSVLKNKEPEPVEQPPQNIDITEDVKNELNRKISEMSYFDYCEIATVRKYNYDCLYRKDNTYPEDLSETYRIYTMILGMDKYVSDSNRLVGEIWVENQKFENAHFINYSDFEKEYKSLYGKDATVTPSQINLLNRFPYVKYDESKTKFIYQKTGVTPERSYDDLATYIEKYDSDTENVYVYVRVGYIVQNKDSTMGIYYDRAATKLNSFIPINRYKVESIIDPTNYTRFTSYKFTFAKEEETNHLTFKSINIVNPEQ